MCKVAPESVIWVNGVIGEEEVICFPTNVNIVSIEIVKPNADLSLKYAERSKELEKELDKFIKTMEEHNN